MHIKKGDKVKFLSGKDRGKTGKVFSVSTKTGKIAVEGLNIFIRHEKSRRRGQKGQKLQVAMPVNASRLMLVCPHCGKSTRKAYTTDERGLKTRMCKNCQKRI